MIKHRFSNSLDADFSIALRQRVNAYFKNENLKKGANTEMLVKTVLAFSTYLVPLGIILSGVVSNIPLLFVLWIIMGLGSAFVGTSVMHDAVHGSYSSKAKVNRLLSLTAQMIGMDPEVWKIQHNVLHHTYSNIEHADEDIAPRYVMRFSPHQPKRWFHRFQHIYVWFFYSITTFTWTLAKDFFKLFHYRRENLVRNSQFNKILSKMLVAKLAYHGVVLIAPMIILKNPVWLTFLMYLTMHLVAGLSLSLIFQPAHVISTAEFVEPEDIEIEENWHVHQLKTTSNFAMNNKLITWIFGGLNYQVEHHLFPNVCHIHYPKISEIVRKTTMEFGLPYQAQKTFSAAVINHYNTLKDLGKG